MAIPHTSKGQFFSIDLVLSLVVFAIIFVFVLSLWNIYSLRLNEKINGEEIELLAFQISDILVDSQGIPGNWQQDVSTLQIIGLQQYPGSLQNDKITAFLAFDYAQSKQLFNIERFEYQFRVLDRTGNVLNLKGMAYNTSTKEIASVKRLVLLDNQTRQIIFTMWKP